MNKYVLVGGFSPIIDYKNKIIENILLLQKNKDLNILFIPFASTDATKSVKNFSKQINEFSLKFDILEDLLLMDESLNNHEILIFWGGNASNLINLMKKINFKKLLSNYNDKIIVGVSAGAIMCSSYGMGDSLSYYDNFKYYNFNMLKGLDLCNILFCPHYEKEELIVYNDEVKKYNLNAYALEDDTALFIVDNKEYIIKNDQTKSVYKFDRKNNHKMKALYENVIYDFEE